MILGTRAVLRLIVPGVDGSCEFCSKPVIYRAQRLQTYVIANVYLAGRWDRVEFYHSKCYVEGGKPYGELEKKSPAQLMREGALYGGIKE